MAKVAAAKTVPTKASVEGFLSSVSDPARRADCDAIVAMMTKATGEAPRMWGTSLVGFGEAYCHYASGRISHAPLLGFSPRKKELSLYLLDGLDVHAADLKALGPHDHGKGCLRLTSLAGVDRKVLARILAASVKNAKRMYPEPKT
jgi:uncharacterized protein DUF1801